MNGIHIIVGITVLLVSVLLIIFYTTTNKSRKKNSTLVITKINKFNLKYKNECSAAKIKEYINAIQIKYWQERPGWVELYENEKIVFLNIPWGESYCHCNAEEYKELTEFIYEKFKGFIPPPK